MLVVMRVGFFVTCLLNTMRPAAAFAGLALVRSVLRAEDTLVVPTTQTCCGQVSSNSGDRAAAEATAKVQIAAFADCDVVVVPSGSCGGMMQLHYPDTPFVVEELCTFLQNRGFRATKAADAEPLRVVLHTSCSSLRETHSAEAAKQLIRAQPHCTLLELEGEEECCGFGGTFCVKYPEISSAMLERKLHAIRATQPDLVVAADMGCLMNIEGGLQHQHTPIPCLHIAELLA
ncbi:MAG: (Fe-S)-binding protein [Actinomycetia bacterium]|nr:(Fe-S)-binding protein [Actinomycetes bacterium]